MSESLRSERIQLNNSSPRGSGATLKPERMVTVEVPKNEKISGKEHESNLVSSEEERMKGAYKFKKARVFFRM